MSTIRRTTDSIISDNNDVGIQLALKTREKADVATLQSMVEEGVDRAGTTTQLYYNQNFSRINSETAKLQATVTQTTDALGKDAKDLQNTVDGLISDVKNLKVGLTDAQQKDLDAVKQSMQDLTSKVNDNFNLVADKINDIGNWVDSLDTANTYTAISTLQGISYTPPTAHVVSGSGTTATVSTPTYTTNTVESIFKNQGVFYTVQDFISSYDKGTGSLVEDLRDRIYNIIKTSRTTCETVATIIAYNKVKYCTNFSEFSKLSRSNPNTPLEPAINVGSVYTMGMADDSGRNGARSFFKISGISAVAQAMDNQDVINKEYKNMVSIYMKVINAVHDGESLYKLFRIVSLPFTTSGMIWQLTTTSGDLAKPVGYTTTPKQLFRDPLLAIGHKFYSVTEIMSNVVNVGYIVSQTSNYYRDTLFPNMSILEFISSVGVNYKVS